MSSHVPVAIAAASIVAPELFELNAIDRPSLFHENPGFSRWCRKVLNPRSGPEQVESIPGMIEDVLLVSGVNPVQASIRAWSLGEVLRAHVVVAIHAPARERAKAVARALMTTSSLLSHATSRGRKLASLLLLVQASKFHENPSYCAERVARLLNDEMDCFRSRKQQQKYRDAWSRHARQCLSGFTDQPPSKGDWLTSVAEEDKRILAFVDSMGATVKDVNVRRFVDSTGAVKPYRDPLTKASKH